MKRALRNVSIAVRLLIVTQVLSLGVLALAVDATRDLTKQNIEQINRGRVTLQEFRERIDILDQIARAHDVRAEELHKRRVVRRRTCVRRTAPVPAPPRSPVADIPPQPPPPPEPTPTLCTVPNPLGGCVF